MTRRTMAEPWFLAALARSLVLLGAALFVSLLGDFWSGITTTQGPSSALPAIKMLWLAAFILFAAGIAHPSVRALTASGDWPEDFASKRRVWLMGVGQAMPALALATPGGQSFSAGVALWPHGADPADAIEAADDALYRAKRSGRNQVLAATSDELDALPGALHALRPVVQPIVRAGDLTVVAYEALSRFPHSRNVPEVFAYAHEFGYGDLLEATAMTRALALPGRPPGAELFVNVSERAMRSARFWELVPDDMSGTVVELHEDRHGLDDVEVAALLDRFRRRGARIGLDDLGVRATDLARIVTLRPDVVKVDRSLVAGCDRDNGQVEVVRLLTDFARLHGAVVCAEGVETPGELAAVRDAGVALVQGYLLGRPESRWTAVLAAPGDLSTAVETPIS